MSSLEVRYLGSKGSYSYEVALNYLSKHPLEKYDLTSYESITSLIKDESSYDDSILIIPLENSTSGDVYETFNILYERGFNIIGMELFEINHVLITKNTTDLKDLKKVYSHPQALIQVSEYLEKNNLLAIPDFSTTAAVQKVVASDEPIGAISSAINVELYDNLQVVASLINNNKLNQTKFLVGKYQKSKQQYQINLNHSLNKKSALFLMFELNSNDSGDLLIILNILSDYQINLYNIKSKPIEGKTFEYYFIVEAYLLDNLSNDFHYQVAEKLKKSSKNYIYNTYNL